MAAAASNAAALSAAANGGDLRLPPIYDVVFVVEDTTVMGATIDEMYEAYILPSLEHFNAGAPKDVA